MKTRIHLIVILLLSALLFSCKQNSKKADISETEKTTNSETQSTQNNNVEKLIKHFESDIAFGKTTPEELRKYYDIGEDDGHDNYFLEGSNIDGSGKTRYNFSFEDKNLTYITLTSNTDFSEAKAYITSKFGEGEILSENYKNRKEWNTENYTLMLNTENEMWELNFEPKGYYPGE